MKVRKFSWSVAWNQIMKSRTAAETSLWLYPRIGDPNESITRVSVPGEVCERLNTYTFGENSLLFLLLFSSSSEGVCSETCLVRWGDRRAQKPFLLAADGLSSLPGRAACRRRHRDLRVRIASAGGGNPWQWWSLWQALCSYCASRSSSRLLIASGYCRGLRRALGSVTMHRGVDSRMKGWSFVAFRRRGRDREKKRERWRQGKNREVIQRASLVIERWEKEEENNVKN